MKNLEPATDQELMNLLPLIPLKNDFTIEWVSKESKIIRIKRGDKSVIVTVDYLEQCDPEVSQAHILRRFENV